MIDRNVRSLWLAIATLTAAFIAVFAGGLAWANGATPPAAMLAAGAAFAAALLLLLAVIRFAADARE